MNFRNYGFLPVIKLEYANMGLYVLNDRFDTLSHMVHEAFDRDWFDFELLNDTRIDIFIEDNYELVKFDDIIEDGNLTEKELDMLIIQRCYVKQFE